MTTKPSTQVMGILNITPDSFYDGGRYLAIESAIDRAFAIAAQGADIIDIGGESTRPKQIYDASSGKPTVQRVPLDEELSRVLPVITTLHQQLPVMPLSIDTVKAEVARQAVEAGASIINDVRGFSDPQMRAAAADTGAHVVVVHIQGDLDTMQQNPHYPNGVIKTLLDWFQQKIDALLDAGIAADKIILDPGIGFGKSVADNLLIIHNVHKLKALGFPILVGVSRKSFMMRLLEKPTEDLLPATLTVNTLLAMAGVEIIRVHDVAAHRDLIKVVATTAGEYKA